MGWSEVKAQVRSIEGFLSDAEAECLYQLAQECGGIIVEIGSWKGKSTVCLALGSKAGAGCRVFAIDPHQGLVNPAGRIESDPTESVFRENIDRVGVQDIVTPLVMKSEDAVNGWRERISLLWIDGAHDYENVHRDFVIWEPHLVERGVIAFHDALYPFGANYPGIRRVLHRYIFFSRQFADLRFCGSIVFATKMRRLSAVRRFLKFGRSLEYYGLILAHTVLLIAMVVLSKLRLLATAKAIKQKALALVQK